VEYYDFDYNTFVLVNHSFGSGLLKTLIPHEDDLFLIEDDHLISLKKGGIDYEIAPIAEWSPCTPIVVNGLAYFASSDGMLHIRGLGENPVQDDKNLIELASK
jgi:hypothetical protein